MMTIVKSLFVENLYPQTSIYVRISLKYEWDKPMRILSNFNYFSGGKC